MLQRTSSEYRIYSEFGLGAHRNTRLNLRDLRGYMDPLVLKRYDDLVGGGPNSIQKHPELIGLMGVRYLVHTPLFRGSHHHIRHPERLGWKDLGDGIYEVPDPAPRAYWIGHAEVLGNELRVQQALPKLDWRHSALLAASDLTEHQLREIGRFDSSAPAVVGRVLSHSINSVRVSVRAPDAGLVVLNDPWFPGFRALLDGRPAPLMRANSLLQALPVQAGSHEISLEFAPSYFIVPAWLSALLLLGSAAAFLAMQFRARRAIRDSRP